MAKEPTKVELIKALEDMVKFYGPMTIETKPLKNAKTVLARLPRELTIAESFAMAKKIKKAKRG